MTFTPYIIPLLASSVILLALAAYSWRAKDVPAAYPLRIAWTFLSLWTTLYALDTASVNLEEKVFWSNLRFPFLAFVPLAVLVMAARHTGQTLPLDRRRLLALSLVPLVSGLLSLTSGYHTLFRYNFRLSTAGPFPILVAQFGAWYWVHIFYSLVLGLIALFWLVHSLRSGPAFYRWQTLALLGCILFPSLADAAYHLGVTLYPGYNLAPSLMVLTGLLTAWALFRHRLLDLIPIARAIVVDSMDDLVLVLDRRDRLIDLNPAARSVFGVKMATIGKPAQVLLAPYPEIVDRYLRVESGRGEVTLGGPEGEKAYDLSISPVRDAQGYVLGRLVVMRDITEHRQAQVRVLNEQRTLAIMETRDRAAREIAEFLHGRVQSRLLAAWHLLGQCESLADKGESPRIRHLLAEARTIIDEVREREIRQACHRLHPSIISVGLVPAIRSVASFFEQHFAITVHADPEMLALDSPLENGIPEVLRLSAYRVVEEALHNILQHAGATRVDIWLRLEGGMRLALEVKDNGHGFDTAAVKSGVGLASIAERVQQVGGTWSVISSLDEGSSLSASFPLAPVPPEAIAASRAR